MTKADIINLIKKNSMDIINIDLYDYSRTEPDCNGESCDYWISFTQYNFSWKKSYYSSSDMDYCPCCGRFYDGCMCDECEGQYDRLSNKDLIKIIEDFEIDDTHRIEIEYNSFGVVGM